MATYMHCRPSCATDISTCASSFIFVRPDYATSLNYQIYAPAFYHHHDQSPPPALPPRRCRRLEDPIITYASNYYATCPHQMTISSPKPPPQSSTISLEPPPLPPRRRLCQRTDRNGIYCDLFNLLERPPPSPPLLKQRRKYTSNDYSPCRHDRPMDFENTYPRIKSSKERKRHCQQSTHYQARKRPEDNLLSTEQYDRSLQKTKKMNDIYQRCSSNKGFFRRVVRNYLCIPMTCANSGYSS